MDKPALVVEKIVVVRTRLRGHIGVAVHEMRELYSTNTLWGRYFANFLNPKIVSNKTTRIYSDRGDLVSRQETWMV